MSLKKFKEDYYPKLTQRQLCRWMGVTDPQFSLVKKQKATTNSDAFKLVAAWMKRMHNIELAYDSDEYSAEQLMEEKYGKLIRSQNKEIMELKAEVSRLQVMIKVQEQAAPVLVTFKEAIIKEVNQQLNATKKQGKSKKAGKLL